MDGSIVYLDTNALDAERYLQLVPLPAYKYGRRWLPTETLLIAEERKLYPWMFLFDLQTMVGGSGSGCVVDGKAYVLN